MTRFVAGHVVPCSSSISSSRGQGGPCNSWTLSRLVLGMAVIAWVAPPVVRAAPVVYQVDAATSALSLTVQVDLGVVVVPMLAQAPGSLVDSIGGTLAADLNGTTLTFSGGSALDFVPHPSSPFLPSASQTGSGAIEDNFAGQGNAFLIHTIQFAMRDAVIDAVGGSAQFGGPVSSLIFDFTAGTVDFFQSIAAPYYGTFPLTNDDPLSNLSPGVLTRSVVGNMENITVPIFVQGALSIIAPGDSPFTLTGQLHASRSLSTTHHWLSPAANSNWLHAANWTPAAVPAADWQAVLHNTAVPSGQTAQVTGNSTVTSVELRGTAGAMQLGLATGSVLTATSGVQVLGGGVLSGVGTVVGHVTNQGILRPGVDAVPMAGTVPEPSCVSLLLFAIPFTTHAIRRRLVAVHGVVYGRQVV